MSNTYFKFKEFTIHQDRCAMKVSTDACIQGAWTPFDSSVGKVLDIGAGTGLLSLMLAQRNADIVIDAIELEKEAARQLEENISDSFCGDRINIYHVDVKDFQTERLYDMIICNPPFFQNSLQGEQANRNMARHNDSLSYEALLSNIDRLLSEHGYASIMLPVAEFSIWKKLLYTNGWYVATMLLVRPRVDVESNRIISICKRGVGNNISTEELCIYKEGGYTQEFVQLLSPFYLNL